MKYYKTKNMLCVYIYLIGEARDAIWRKGHTSFLISILILKYCFLHCYLDVFYFKDNRSFI